MRATLVARALLALVLIALPATRGRAAETLESLVAKVVAATTTGAKLDAYEPALAKRVADMSRPEAEDGIDFDWVTDSQDPDYATIKKTIKTAVARAGEDKATLTVTFSQYTDSHFAIDYSLRKLGDGWVIHDVVYPNGNFALRQAAGLSP